MVARDEAPGTSDGPVLCISLLRGLWGQQGAAGVTGCESHRQCPRPSVHGGGWLHCTDNNQDNACSVNEWQ